MQDSALAENVRTHRDAAGLTQLALASKAEVSLRTVQEIESGRAKPTLTTVSKIAQALDLSPVALLDTYPRGVAS